MVYCLAFHRIATIQAGHRSDGWIRGDNSVPLSNGHGHIRMPDKRSEDPECASDKSLCNGDLDIGTASPGVCQAIDVQITPKLNGDKRREVVKKLRGRFMQSQLCESRHHRCAAAAREPTGTASPASACRRTLRTLKREQGQTATRQVE